MAVSAMAKRHLSLPLLVSRTYEPDKDRQRAALHLLLRVATSPMMPHGGEAPPPARTTSTEIITETAPVRQPQSAAPRQRGLR